MLRARLLALLTVLLLLPAGLSARARYFCHMQARVVDSCCCGGGARLAASAGSEAEAKATDCCVRLKQGTLPPVASCPESAQPSATLALLATNAVEILPLAHGALLSPAGGARGNLAARGPPLFLKYCSLLI